MVRTDLPDKVMANLLEPSESDEILLTRWSHCALTDSPSATLGRGQSMDIPPPQVNARIVLRYDAAQPADYLVSGILGEGGMGIVFDAEQVYFGRRVALKMIKPVLASDPMAERAFFREAVIASRLDHPGIIPVHDFGVSQDGRALYAMMKASGVPWHSVIREKSLSENLAILDRVADVVAYAHLQGVLHRDIKPANVLLGEHGEVWLCDWGVALARLPDGTYSHARPAGTPAYMPPEMARCDAANIDPASDIYLLGAVLFEILTGDPPHAGENAGSTLLNSAQNMLRSTKKNTGLLRIAYTAMASQPEQRHAGARQFQQAIKICLDEQRSTKLAREGKALLDEAMEDGDYELFTQAAAAFDKALAIRADNPEARSGRMQSLIAYSDAACKQGEYELAESVLQSLPKGRRKTEQLEKIVKAARKAKRRRRNSRAFAVAGILILLGMLGYSAWYYYIQRVMYRNFVNSPTIRQNRMMQDEIYLVQGITIGFRDLHTAAFSYIALGNPAKDPLAKYAQSVLGTLESISKINEKIPDARDLKACHAFCRRAITASNPLKNIKMDIEKKLAEGAKGNARNIMYLAHQMDRLLEFMDAYREKYMGAES